MDVHQHTHTARRKWTHYFWEFFMLFLAVTLSFLVENRREHYVEHQRAKIYAGAMFRNLQKDTAELKQFVERGEFAVNFVDSFLTLLSAREPGQIPSGKLYWYGLWGGYIRGFEPNDATFQQMRNSGSLRYFGDNDLEQLIGEYDQVTRSMRILNEIDQAVFLETRKARAKIFDFRYNIAANQVVQQSVYTNYNPSAIDSFMRLNQPLLSTDKILFNEYAELCRSRNLQRQLRNAKQALELAQTIIEKLKIKFHLN